MAVKLGYKHTDIGITPDDWNVQSISSVARIVGGGTPSTTVAEYWDGEIPWVSAGDVSKVNGRYVQETEDCITELGLSSCPANIMPRGTTIIIARGATTGRMAQLGMDMAFNQTCYVLLSGNTLDRNYLYYSMLFSVNQFRHSRMVLYLARLQLALLMNGRSPCLPSPNSASSPQLLAM